MMHRRLPLANKNNNKKKQDVHAEAASVPDLLQATETGREKDENKPTIHHHHGEPSYRVGSTKQQLTFGSSTTERTSQAAEKQQEINSTKKEPTIPALFATDVILPADRHLRPQQQQQYLHSSPCRPLTNNAYMNHLLWQNAEAYAKAKAAHARDELVQEMIRKILFLGGRFLVPVTSSLDGQAVWRNVSANTASWRLHEVLSNIKTPPPKRKAPEPPVPPKKQKTFVAPVPLTNLPPPPPPMQQLPHLAPSNNMGSGGFMPPPAFAPPFFPGMSMMMPLHAPFGFAPPPPPHKRTAMSHPQPYVQAQNKVIMATTKQHQPRGPPAGLLLPPLNHPHMPPHAKTNQSKSQGGNKTNKKNEQPPPRASPKLLPPHVTRPLHEQNLLWETNHMDIFVGYTTKDYQGLLPYGDWKLQRILLTMMATPTLRKPDYAAVLRRIEKHGGRFLQSEPLDDEFRPSWRLASSRQLETAIQTAWDDLLYQRNMHSGSHGDAWKEAYLQRIEKRLPWISKDSSNDGTPTPLASTTALDTQDSPEPTTPTRDNADMVEFDDSHDDDDMMDVPLSPDAFATSHQHGLIVQGLLTAHPGLSEDYQVFFDYELFAPDGHEQDFVWLVSPKKPPVSTTGSRKQSNKNRTVSFATDKILVSEDESDESSDELILTF